MMIIDPNQLTEASNLTASTSFSDNTEATAHTDISTSEQLDEWTDLSPIPMIIASNKPSALRRPSKPMITILLIGETGTGKTTFMSLLVNLFQGRSLFELEDVHNEESESGLSKTQSQTTAATLYTVTTSDGFILNILDTPGLADTRGIDQDNQHKAEINRAIKEFVTSIDAVIIMANGTVQRLSVATDYTLNVIATMFPHSIIDNIGLVLTNSDPLSLNFQRESLPPSLRDCPYWVIQNPLALAKKYRSETSRFVPGPIVETMKGKLEMGYREAVSTLDHWLRWLDQREARPTKEINDLYEKSIHIESRVGVALSHITSLAEKRNEWERISTDLSSATAAREGIQASIAGQQAASRWELRETKDRNLLCMQEGCHRNCESPSLRRILEAKPWSYSWICLHAAGATAASALTLSELGWVAACAAGVATTAGVAGLVGVGLWWFSGSSLAKCDTCAHTVLQHRLYNLTHAEVPGQVDRETQQRFADAQTAEETLRIAKETVQEELDRIQAQTEKVQATLRDLIDQYNQISLNGNFVGYIRSVIDILELREQDLRIRPGTEAELEVIAESMGKLRAKVKVLEDQTKANEGVSWRTVTRANGVSVTSLSDSIH